MTIQHNCIIALGVLFSAAARAQVADQYQVKAAFLYNFAKFVEWPPRSYKNPSAPFVIGVLGKNPFGNALVEAVATVDAITVAKGKLGFARRGLQTSTPA